MRSGACYAQPQVAMYSRFLWTRPIGRCGDVGLPEIQPPSVSKIAQYESQRTSELETFTSEAVSYRDIYELPTPLVVIAIVGARRLPISRDGLHTTTLAAIAFSLCVVIWLLLQKQIEAYSVAHGEDYSHSTIVMMVIIHVIIFYICNLLLGSAIFFLFYISIRDQQFAYAVLMLLLFIEHFPASALPGLDTQQADLHIGLSARQSASTVWTVRLEGWPNTGYCARMHFGINKEQTVSQ